MKRWLAALAVFYCLGIILASLFRVNFFAVLGLGVIILVFACLNFRKSHIFLLLLFILTLLLGGLNLKNSFLRPKCHISNFVRYKDNTVYSLSGFIDSAPEIKDNRASFIFRVQEAQSGEFKWRCCGKVLVNLDFAQELSYGDNLMLVGNLRRPYSFKSGQGYKEFLARQGIYLLMRIKDMRQIIRQDGNSGSRLMGFSFRLRQKMEGIIRRYLPDLEASILSAMVLGQRRGISWLVNNSMVRSGTVHILVVSGFNVGIVAFIVNLLLKITRIRRKARIILTVICLIIYCLITGASNPVIRATVMGSVFLLAYLFKRQPDIYNSLACAALFILLVNPRQLFDVGFQLSFASVGAIVYFYPKLRRFLRVEEYRGRVLRFICDGLLVSLSAWMGTMGIIAYNFRIISPVTVLANLLIAPLAGLITLCGFTLVLCGLFFPFLAGAVSITCAMLVTLLLNINAVVIKLPFACLHF